ncbi:MAG: DUF5011 domain-containing protein [Nanoarchaeota archaeon]|nr:DUF5011 domain-containing protein [Nanoarchaeota archaeon]
MIIKRGREMAKRQRNGTWVLFVIFGLAAVVALFMMAGRGNLTGGVIGSGEVCNDGNINSGDGCSDAGLVEVGWTCDETTTPNVCTLIPAADTTAPAITLIGNAVVNILVGGSYTDEGATALDDVDGDLTASIVSVGTVDTTTAGTYIITYDVSDLAGNAATQVIRTVNVVEVLPDTIAPVITLIGSAAVTINVGDFYTDEGATATDDVDGDLTASIVSVGTVDTTVIGVYTMTYDVSDLAGNAATQVIRTVNVLVPCTPDWTDEAWGACSNGVKTRTPVDNNDCGVDYPSPLSTTCSEESTATSTTTEANTETTTTTTTTTGSLCSPNEESCANGNLYICNGGTGWDLKQTCELGCSDNKCIVKAETAETTNTPLAGSVVKGPVESTKQFFTNLYANFSSNKTRMYLILGGVGILAAGLVSYLVYFKKKLMKK